MANPVHKYQKLIIKTANVYGLCPIDSIFWLVGQCQLNLIFIDNSEQVKGVSSWKISVSSEQ